jgi:hypothetical protein
MNCVDNFIKHHAICTCKSYALSQKASPITCSAPIKYYGLMNASSNVLTIHIVGRAYGGSSFNPIIPWSRTMTSSSSEFSTSFMRRQHLGCVYSATLILWLLSYDVWFWLFYCTIIARLHVWSSPWTLSLAVCQSKLIGRLWVQDPGRLLYELRISACLNTWTFYYWPEASMS